MDMHNAGRVQVLGQHKLPWVLADHTDVVVAYQWDVFDGYEHLDVLHGGYPLVHNSVLYKVYVRQSCCFAMLPFGSRNDAIIWAMTKTLTCSGLRLLLSGRRGVSWRGCNHPRVGKARC